MIRLAKPHFDEKTIKNISSILRSGNLVQGESVMNFEKKIQNYLGVENAIVVSSGTAALHLALLALEIGVDDEVIIPAFTYPATGNVVEVVGGKSKLVDISLEDLCIDTTKVSDAISEKTKAIIPVHEFGQAANMTPIINLANKYGLKIIEDAACALGSKYNDQKVGTLGDLGCFSFHPRKAITTGEGGCVVTNCDELAEKIRSLRNHGISKNNKGINFEYASLNYRMTEFQAALGIAQLENLDKNINYRSNIAKFYDEKLSSIDWIQTPTRLAKRKSIFQTYHLLLNDRVNRDEIIKSLKKLKIETNIGSYALHKLKYYRKKYLFSENNFPNSKKAYIQGIAIPIGDHLKADDYLYISDSLTRVI